MRASLAVLIISVLVLAGLLAGLDPAQPASELAPTAGSGVRLELRAGSGKATLDGPAGFEVWLVNDGPRAVTLVEPGDGSTAAWRTPIIQWSTSPSHQFERSPLPGRRMCGNVNALKVDEVFTLRLGQRHRLSNWIGGPLLPSSGEARVAVRYLNDPARPFVGVSLGPPNEAAARAIRGSTPIDLVSNQVTVNVDP
jgi:hypothetical protein